MAISFQDFKRESVHADDMVLKSETEEMRQYWRYYGHGIRRLYHGEKYDSIEKHRMRMMMINSKTDSTRRKGEGYLAGFEYDKGRGSVGRRGRKQVGEVQIPALLVSQQISKELEELSRLSGESGPDMRRRFLEKGIFEERRKWRTL